MNSEDSQTDITIHRASAWAGDPLPRNNFDFIRFLLASLVVFSHPYPCGLVVAPLAMRQPVAAFDVGQIRRLTVRILRLEANLPVGAFAHNPYPNAINGALWSIPFEFWCYIGLALCGVSGLLRKRLFIALAFLSSILVSLAFDVNHLRPGGGILGAIFGYPVFWARLLPYFLAGMLFYLYRSLIPYRGSLALISTVALIAALRVNYGLTAILPIAGTYILFWFAFHPSINLRGWAKRGDFSYGVYLYGFPIQQLMMFYWGTSLAPSVLFIIAWPLTLIVGMASWRLVEKHFIRLKQAGQRRAAAVSEPASVL